MQQMVVVELLSINTLNSAEYLKHEDSKAQGVIEF